MDAQSIRQARKQNAKMRERDFARIHGISEAALVAAHVGHGAIRLNCDADAILSGVSAFGEVLALTRNESAVHEKIGTYGGVKLAPAAGVVIGDEIDLRVFPPKWKHAFAVEKADESGQAKRSLQFFDAAGDAVHKIHLREASNAAAYEVLVARMVAVDQSTDLGAAAVEPPEPKGLPASREALHDSWSKLQDTHQFHFMLRHLHLERLQAIEMAHEDFAWPLELDGMAKMLHGAAGTGLPIMAFVGNQGCIQIHTGPVSSVQPMGPWLNIMDETFHMHLRLDHIVDLWAVRKPTKDGHVTSVEAYGADRSLIIQFFGAREEGNDERAGWRRLVEDLSRRPRSSAA